MGGFPIEAQRCDCVVFGIFNVFRRFLVIIFRPDVVCYGWSLFLRGGVPHRVKVSRFAGWDGGEIPVNVGSLRCFSWGEVVVGGGIGGLGGWD